jgi:diaminopimelate epimerase
MRSSKWHAAGNVYLLTEERLGREHVPALVGDADGILEVVGLGVDWVDVVIWNADGSQAEMSGNGTRIAARWLADRTGAQEVRVRVGPREVVARILDGEVEQEMGEVHVHARERIAGLEVTPVEVGNPHAVVVGDPDDLPLIGPLLETHPRFPNRTNVQVARVDGPGVVTARVWERGVGETRSSGTSAVAVAAATHGEGEVAVRFPGGELRVRLEAGRALLVGSAGRLRVPRQVLVYVYRDANHGRPEFLLMRRIARLGGFWQGVTGAPEWGESDEEAAVREVLEETGLDVSADLTLVDYRYVIRRPGENAQEWEGLYGSGVEGVPEETYCAPAPLDWKPQLSWEHDEYCWCVLEQGLELLHWPENRAALSKVAAILARD